MTTKFIVSNDHPFEVIPPDILLKLDSVTLKTKKGFIQGETVLYNNTPINVFKGIPFAKPPVGPLRFRKPEPIDKWKGIYHANTYKSACAQSILRKKFYLTSFFMREQSI